MKYIHILVVDDQDSMRKVIVHILKELGYENVDQTATSRHALELVMKRDYDLLISDWHMPNLTGLQLLKKIRRIERIKHLKVMLVTGDNEKSHVQEAIKAGVDSFIVKPFSPAGIAEKMLKIFPSTNSH